MTVPAGLESKKAAVDAELERLLTGRPAGLYEAMRYAVLDGGKRFRPLLLLAAGEAFGAARGVLLPYACAVELIHSYSLVHDDLPAMDNDDIRRGKPSCHKAFGEGRAILAGDGLLSLAFEVLSRAPAEAGHWGRKERAVRVIAEAAGVGGMITGQWLDIDLDPAVLDERVFLDLVGRKTGALIKASVVAGAALAGASDEALRAMEEFGAAVGLAFQLRDDILDAAPSSARSEVNAVSLFGRDGARARIESSLESAVRTVRKLAVDSSELEFLAGTLRLASGAGP